MILGVLSEQGKKDDELWFHLKKTFNGVGLYAVDRIGDDHFLAEITVNGIELMANLFTLEGIAKDHNRLRVVK